MGTLALIGKVINHRSGYLIDSSSYVDNHLTKEERTTTKQAQHLENQLTKSEKVGDVLIRDIEKLSKEVDLITKGTVA